ncbi:MAG TPA: hypothetical protein VER03_12645 [Bryobacteraceae bacterium]|nr:hypothetical protein [Bryobacteraceae bacterium]
MGDAGCLFGQPKGSYDKFAEFLRGHDIATGNELWSVPDGTEVKVPTPVIAGDLVIVTAGYRTGGRPIFAIEAATGVEESTRLALHADSDCLSRDCVYLCG